ncbi:hypothetical protein Bca4012_004635 [Brassica carinata]|uniref:RNase H type-1 domain-containing protein n=3 Tax=Brassica TaxID=3705 RepID=A0A0D3BCN6_BRAOL|nr:unnamed protein product [Brassica napus]CDY24271.1 BnaC03g42440D [Brassica napus]VDC94147.1 unnamed protein product [Brassica oleracea]
MAWIRGTDKTEEESDDGGVRLSRGCQERSTRASTSLDTILDPKGVDSQRFVVAGKRRRWKQSGSVLRVGQQPWRVASDAAWDATTGNCVLGWHISDADATSASNFTSKRRHVPSALVAEALALKTAVSTAVLRGATSLVVSSDSKTLINLLVVKENHLHVQGILFDIHRLCSTLIFVYFQFVPRNANSLADALAKSALCALKNSPCVDE